MDQRMNSNYRHVFGAAQFVAIALGIVFLFSGIQHILRPQEFLATVSGYGLAAPKVNVLLASVLPWAEAIVGMSLVSRLFFRGALLLATILFGIYGVAIAAALSRGLAVDCGCFDLGGGPSPITGITFMRTACLFGLAVLLFIVELLVAPAGGIAGGGPEHLR